MHKKLISFIFLLSLITVYSQNPCLNKPNGFECGTNRFCSNQNCKHKNLLPFSKFDILFALCLILGSTATILCGIGGGMIYVSLLVYVEGFDFREALPLGSAIIFVQNTILLIYYSMKKHPTSGKNLIVFDNFMLLIPNILVGNLSGYVLFVTFPKLILQMIFAVTLAFFIYIVFKKTYETFLKENEIIEKERIENEKLEKERAKLLHIDEKTQLVQDDKKEENNKNEIKEEGHVIEIDYDIAETSFEEFIFRHIFLFKLLFCLLCLFLYFFFLFLRGNILLKSFAGIEYCSTSYFVVYGLGIFLQLKIGIIISYLLIKESQFRQSVPDIRSGKINYTPWNCTFLSFCGFFIGFGSIIFGLAGGSITNPLLMALGFDPLHAVATSVSIMEVTTISTLINYSINGFLIIPYAIFVGCVVICTTLIGLLVLNFILNKFHRTSFISFLMGCVFFISFVLLIRTITLSFMKPGDKFVFNNYCSLSSYTNRTYEH